MKVNGHNFYIQDLDNYNEEFLKEVILEFHENYVHKVEVFKSYKKGLTRGREWELIPINKLGGK